jgi:hypothetical protein
LLINELDEKVFTTWGHHTICTKLHAKLPVA